MLLVDHDQAEVGDRREDRRARADADARLAASAAAATGRALALGEAGVKHGDTLAEAGARSGASVCGVSAISGTSRIAPRPRVQRRLDRGAGRPRSCREPVTPCSRAPRRRRLLAVERGDHRSRRPRWSAVSTRASRCPPRPRRRAAGGGARRARVSTSPRDSRRRRVARSAAGRRRQPAARQLGPRGQRLAARPSAASPSRPPPASTALPSGVARSPLGLRQDPARLRGRSPDARRENE